MAPTAIEAEPVALRVKNPQPIQPKGVLEQFESFDVTPAIGKEFPKADLAEWINAPNSDDLLRDLAVTSKIRPIPPKLPNGVEDRRPDLFGKKPIVSQRGVVFFRAQDNLTDELQKKLILKLGELTGSPATSGLHIHPVLNSERDLGGNDLEISTISSKQHKQLYRRPEDNDGVVTKKVDDEQWHADISFEPVPANYTSLRLTELPKTGGGKSLIPGEGVDNETCDGWMDGWMTD